MLISCEGESTKERRFDFRFRNFVLSTSQNASVLIWNTVQSYSFEEHSQILIKRSQQLVVHTQCRKSSFASVLYTNACSDCTVRVPCDGLPHICSILRGGGGSPSFFSRSKHLIKVNLHIEN